MTSSSRILIAGAGWRVTRFVVPALISEGVTPDRLTIVRRSVAAIPDPSLEGIRVVTDLRALDKGDYGVTINCVTRESLVAMQRALLARAPRAIHFCDTPIYDHRSELLAVLINGRGRVFSLEDWPLMPNLRFLARSFATASPPAHLRIEHFGIVGHFLSLYRGLAGMRVGAHQLRRRDKEIVAHPAPGKTVTFVSPKDATRAKAWIRTASTLIEDFHEVESAAHENSEVLYRIVDGSTVRYLSGAREISAHRLSPAVLAMFTPLHDRKVVHELDKMIGLTTLFRAVLYGRGYGAYGYLQSFRDAITARRLEARGASWLF